MRFRWIAAAPLVVLGLGSAALWPWAKDSHPPVFAAPQSAGAWPIDPAHVDEWRWQALTSAKVWRPANAAAADLGANPPDPTGVLSQPIVPCRYRSRPAHGTTT